VLKAKGVQISMDGKGRWRDNVFVERLWRLVKYEEVYSTPTPTWRRRNAHRRLSGFFNDERPHQALATARRRSLLCVSDEWSTGEGWRKRMSGRRNHSNPQPFTGCQSSPRTPLVTDYGGGEWTLSTRSDTEEDQNRSDRNRSDRNRAEHKLS